MKMTVSKGALRLVLGLAALVLMILWSGGCFKKKLPAGKINAQPGVPVAANAELMDVQMTEIKPRIDIVGTVESQERVDLSSRISADVKEVFVSAGNAVKKGQLLITLDAREMSKQLAMGETELKQAETDYERQKKLMASNATSDQQLTTARTNYERAKAAVERLNVMLSYTKITSPIDGIVTERHVEVGDLANPGQLLLTVYDSNRLRIVVPVPVRLIDQLQLNDSVSITLEPYGDVQGTVSDIVGEIDPRSRTQDVKIRLGQLEKTILPGTFGRVWVYDETRQGVLVPQSAIISVGQLTMVETEKDGLVKRRMVKTGRSQGDQIEILSGLNTGDTIVVKPAKQ